MARGGNETQRIQWRRRIVIHGAPAPERTGGKKGRKGWGRGVGKLWTRLKKRIDGGLGGGKPSKRGQNEEKNCGKVRFRKEKKEAD